MFDALNHCATAAHRLRLWLETFRVALLDYYTSFDYIVNKLNGKDTTYKPKISIPEEISGRTNYYRSETNVFVDTNYIYHAVRRYSAENNLIFTYFDISDFHFDGKWKTQYF